MGYKNNASGYNSSALGNQNAASGSATSAVGLSNKASNSYASAVGYTNKASGYNSSALGNQNAASGSATSAVGMNNKASNSYASAVGRSNTADGENSSAVGYTNKASGYNSSALGNQNAASGGATSAVGMDNKASNSYASAVGYSNIASGENSSAVGYKNKATNQYSSAFGSLSQAVVDYGTAIGYKSYADRKAWSSSNNYSAAFVPSGISSFNKQQKAVWQSTSAALAVGDPNNKNGNGVITRQITGVAAGSEDTDAVNVAQLKEAVNSMDLTEYMKTNEFGTQATTWFTNNTSTIDTALTTMGYLKAVTSPCSYDKNGNLLCGQNEGIYAETNNATVLGTGNNESISGEITVGSYSVAVGFGNNLSDMNDVTVGEYSSAVGAYNAASGYQSSAVGYRNEASSDWSSAVGYDNAAYAEGSSAVGYQNIASEWMSSAFGSSSQAVVAFGTAIGYKSYADREAWHETDNNYSAAFAPSDMSGFNAKQKAVWQSTSAALSVGDPDSKGYKAPITRQITGVAAGSEDTDAVNVAQLREVADMVGSGGGSFSPISVSGNSGSFGVKSGGKLNIHQYHHRSQRRHGYDWVKQDFNR